MLMIELDPETERQVAEVAQRNGISVDALVREAIEQVLEDIEDLDAAERAMRDYEPRTNVGLDEVKRRLGLAD